LSSNNERVLDRLYLMDLLSALLVLLAICIALFAGAVWLAHRPYFALQSVLVEGIEEMPLRHVNIASVRATALPSIQGNFFTVNLATVREAFESVAWVRHARVRRQWPNRLVVAVEEHKAVALWNDDGLVNNFGEAFSANLAEAEAEGDLPQLNGPENSQRDVLQHFADFSRDFQKVGLRPTEVTLSPRYSWSVRFDNATSDGLQVEFGREDDAATLNGRIDRMLATYPIVTAKWPHLTLVDLRYPNGFAIRADNLRLANDPVKKGSTRPAAKVTPHPSHPTSRSAAPKVQPLKT
jgi:cell division protein FtsQ